jgi:hypothetical protein
MRRFPRMGKERNGADKDMLKVLGYYDGSNNGY